MFTTRFCVRRTTSPLVISSCTDHFVHAPRPVLFIIVPRTFSHLTADGSGRVHPLAGRSAPRPQAGKPAAQQRRNTDKGDRFRAGRSTGRVGGGPEAPEAENLGSEAEPTAAANGVRDPVLRRAGDYLVVRKPRVGFVGLNMCG